MIRQNRTNILCPACGRVRQDSWQQANRLLAFVTDADILKHLEKDGYQPDGKRDELKSLEKKLNKR